MSDGRVEFEITADGKKAFASIDEITDALQKSGVKWEKEAKTSTDNISNAFEGMLKKITAAFSAAAIGKALLNFGQDAIQAASDLQEVQNVVDVTFGESASKIESWAKKAGDQFGLTETQAKRFTSTLGAMMKSAGMSGSEIADISTDLAGLAADMASFYNLDFDTAFQKIRSGISGETEPLKQLGINMSVANLNAFALQQGLSKTFEQMTQGEQTMLRYQYLMQATADAQGDFARTSDSYANAQRRLETAVDTLKQKLGTPFLDVVGKATSAFAGFIDELGKEPERTVLDDFADIDKRTQEKITEIKAKAEEARTLTGVLEDIGKAADDSKTKISEITDDSPDGSKLNGVKEGLQGVANQSNLTGEEIKQALQPLEGATETITSDNELWIETCQRLTSVLPGLKDIINEETGEIKGGTQAIRDYIDAWEQGQIGIAMQSAHEQKRTALDTKFSELPGLELDKTVAEYRVKKAQEQLQEIYDKYGVELNQPGGLDSWIGLTQEQKEEIRKETDYLNALEQNAKDATAAYEKQKAAYDEAVAAY